MNKQVALKISLSFFILLLAIPCSASGEQKNQSKLRKKPAVIKKRVPQLSSKNVKVRSNQSSVTKAYPDYRRDHPPDRVHNFLHGKENSLEVDAPLIQK